MNADTAQLMARYNRWMNDRVYATCARLDDSERKADRGAFFGSIHGTLNHLLLTDRIWLGRFTQVPYPVASLAEEVCADFAVLRQERQNTDDAIDAWAGQLDDAALATPVRFVSAGDKTIRHFPLWLAVTHVFNHQAHHRGQITTLLSQTGLDMGVTDLIHLPDI